MAGPLLGVAAHAAVAPPKAPSTHEPPPVPMPAEFPPTQSRGEHAGSTLLPGVKSRDTTQDGDAGAVERQLSQAHQVGKQVSLFPSEQNSPGAAKAAKVGMVLSDLQNKAPLL
ncbi:unnamed protein product [Prorocentrum cordatum]|uniref:Uncharacterized protein n=1 Tax=Prorocentrum cordatum TaxID=2364126 RepID=A0ABN9RYK6_9DINO|nr:unnamed protein product [Polarella glacialis]